MELKKGQNMLEHEDEIFGRPKRTWFQTEKEKEKASCEFYKFVCFYSRLHLFSALSKQQYESGFSTGEKKAVQEKDQGEVRHSPLFKLLALTMYILETQARQVLWSHTSRQATQACS